MTFGSVIAREHSLVPLLRRKVVKAAKRIIDDAAPSVKYIKQRTRLKVRYKGKAYKAMLRLDGQVRYGNAVYKTPTAAAKAVTGRSAINGWRFWHYERAQGDWVPLATLRRVSVAPLLRGPACMLGRTSQSRGAKWPGGVMFSGGLR